MRHQAQTAARRHRAPVVLLMTLLLSVGTACAWGGDDASGGDPEQTDTAEDGGGGGTDGDGGGDGGDGDGGDGGGAQPSPIRVSRATEQANGVATVIKVADEAARDMAAECPGGELCVEIHYEPAVRDCVYTGSDPGPGELIDVGETLTLFGSCDGTDEESPESTESTDGPTTTDEQTGTDGGSSEDDQG